MAMVMTIAAVPTATGTLTDIAAACDITVRFAAAGHDGGASAARGGAEPHGRSRPESGRGAAHRRRADGTSPEAATSAAANRRTTATAASEATAATDGCTATATSPGSATAGYAAAVLRLHGAGHRHHECDRGHC